ncbi:hypothetical protein ACWGHA_11095 [Streptomyces xanthophaeus]
MTDSPAAEKLRALLDPQTTDWHQVGCHRSCRFEHTNVHGSCTQADNTTPLPALSVLRVRTDEEGERVIVTERFDFRALTDLIKAAIQEIDITLGPNSLRLIRDGHRMKLTDGEYEHMALAVATALTVDEAQP